jgi:hypothetical protein
MEILPGKPASMISPRVEIDLTEDKGEDLETHTEHAGAQHSVKIKQEIPQQQTPNLETDIPTHEDNLTQHGSNFEQGQPTLDDVPPLPEQPSLDRDVLERAPKSQKKVIAAAKPILATVPAATSRRVGPILRPVPPTTREIFRDSVAICNQQASALKYIF